MQDTAAKYPGLQHQPGVHKHWGRLRHSIQVFMRSQFGCPTGIWGRIVGSLMTYAPSNQDRIQWTIGLLDLQPTDRVLEIGFGPGFAIKAIHEVVPRGFIAGVDHSEVMVHQASRRNKSAIRAGKVDLRHASVSSLPVFDKPFDKIFSINSIHFWTDPVSRLKDLRELLRPGGMIAVTLQPRSRGSTSETTHTIGRELVSNLERAGFMGTRLEFKRAKPAPVVCALGIRE